VNAQPAPLTATVRHNRVDLALHRLAEDSSGASVHPLLRLHGLGESTLPEAAEPVVWPGAVYGLDFTGHGASTLPVGGGYTSEILVGDVDAALQHLDSPVTILGRGLGAYIGMLAAAARPDVVMGVVLADGPGLAGGGVHPGSPALVRPAERTGTPDPYALLELARDVRPADYARNFAGYAMEGSDLDLPLWVATVVRPAWLEAIVGEPGVGEGSIERGLATYASPGV